MKAVLSNAGEVRAFAGLWSSLFLIVDGGLDSELEEKILAVDKFARREWVYSNTEYWQQERDGPLLIQAVPDSPLLAAMLDEWSQLHWGGMLQSDAPIDVVLQHLRMLRHAQMPDGGLSLLRLHEPRALRGFVEGLSDGEQDILLGPIQSWTWCEWSEGHGDWYRLTRQSETPVPPLETPLALTGNVIRALDAQRVDYCHRCWVRRLRNQSIAALEVFDDDYLLQAVGIQVNHAMTLGFVNDEDLGAYLNLFFRHHRRLQDADSSLTRLLNDTEQPAWRRLMQMNDLLVKEMA
ncbi:DUF4123 domain-containing protein [Burkholderia cepacia]|uniref:DUF4123 domain-containing protein n=1 Tax=Burkholderia cepacia TaxID=292 RepID=UPI0013F3E386|nr:DUF4123 domain-containing protein [Burkholderia cepacia]NHB05165.1 DUF4123 domain-containing protein [Burkholderia cepacia]